MSQGIIGLLETMEEALNHILVQLDELRLEESLAMLTDFAGGLQSIEESLARTLPQVATAHGVNLRQALTHTLDAYQNGEIAPIQEQVRNHLLPSFTQWKIALQSKFNS